MKTKKEFLNFLDKRLSILKEEEKNEVLNEYNFTVLVVIPGSSD